MGAAQALRAKSSKRLGELADTAEEDKTRAAQMSLERLTLARGELDNRKKAAKQLEALIGSFKNGDAILREKLKAFRAQAKQRGQLRQRIEAVRSSLALLRQKMSTQRQHEMVAAALR